MSSELKIARKQSGQARRIQDRFDLGCARRRSRSPIGTWSAAKRTASRTCACTVDAVGHGARGSGGPLGDDGLGVRVVVPEPGAHDLGVGQPASRVEVLLRRHGLAVLGEEPQEDLAAGCGSSCESVPLKSRIIAEDRHQSSRLTSAEQLLELGPVEFLDGALVLLHRPAPEVEVEVARCRPGSSPRASSRTSTSGPRAVRARPCCERAAVVVGDELLELRRARGSTRSRCCRARTTARCCRSTRSRSAASRRRRR